MHKIYENNDLMMFFKKRYCHCCGNVLDRARTERIVRKGDPDYENYSHTLRGGRLHGDILVIGKEYFCSRCDKSFSCEEQGKIINAQKYYHRHIVTKDEILSAQKTFNMSYILAGIIFILVFCGFIYLALHQ